MTKTNTKPQAIASPLPSPQEAFDDVRDSFERFCLLWGIEAMEQMLEEDAGALCGDRHSRNKERKGHRWGATKGPIGFHDGKTKVRRPRVRGKDKKEIPLPSQEAAQDEDCRLFILDGAKSLKKAVRNTFGKHTPIQRCQVHKSCNIIDRLRLRMHFQH